MRPRPRAVGVTVDAELRDAFLLLGTQIADAARDARAASQAANEASTAAHSANKRAERLERHVFGSRPPSDDEGSASGATTPRAPAIVARIVTGEHADQELRARLERVEKMNEKQCAAMGVSKEEEPSVLTRILAFVKSREGGNLLLRIVVVLVTAYGAKSAIQAQEAAVRVERAATMQAAPPQAPRPLATGAASQ